MLIWHAGLGMLISLPKKVCKGNYLPAEEWAYSKTRRYRRLIMLSKQNWRLKNADCHQLQYFLYKTGCAALEVNKQQFSISIVVPLPSPFSRKVPFAPPQKKTSSIWTSKQYVDRWFGSVRSKNIPPGIENDVNDCLSDDFTTCLIRNPRLQTTRPCNAVRDLDLHAVVSLRNAATGKVARGVLLKQLRMQVYWGTEEETCLLCFLTCCFFLKNRTEGTTFDVHIQSVQAS